MSQTPQQVKKEISPDWFVQGVLTKIGDIFDRLTGRGWKPGSSLATSELIEKLKGLLDREATEDEEGRKFVPHNIKLKMQWDKFSTDKEDALAKLENEMLTAVVDHINDRHYYTYSPLAIEVKPDYFTEGVKLFVSFDKGDGDDSERELDVAGTSVEKPDTAAAEPDTPAEIPERKIRIRYELNAKPVERVITLMQGKRLSVGRTKENDIAIDDSSISKFHAAIVLNAEGSVVVADTGSTNGTFVGGERIAYGKAVGVSSGEKVKFGTVEVTIDLAKAPQTPEPEPKKIEPAKTEVYKVGDFQFAKKTEAVIAPIGDETPRVNSMSSDELPATQPAIDITADDGEKN